jgi:hypothetical protein
MTDDIKALNARIDMLEGLLREVLHHHTPQGRFEAEQAYIAFRKETDPLYGSYFGRHTDDERTRVPNVARMMPRYEYAPSDQIDGAKGV